MLLIRPVTGNTLIGEDGFDLGIKITFSSAKISEGQRRIKIRKIRIIKSIFIRL